MNAPSRPGLLLLSIMLAALLCGPVAAQEPRQEPTPGQPVPQQPHPAEAVLPRRALEFAVGGDGLWLGYRSRLHRGEGGYGTIGLTFTDDDDVALAGRLMRFGERGPIALGVGLGLMGVRVEQAGAELGAITLTGAAEYVLGFDYPLRFALEATYAPNAATFGDGTRVLELLGRVETDLSNWGTAYVGFRHLEVDLEGAADAEIESAFHIGLRLGL